MNTHLNLLRIKISKPELFSRSHLQKSRLKSRSQNTFVTKSDNEFEFETESCAFWDQNRNWNLNV